MAKTKFNYRPFDTIYDIESFDNVFTNSQYLPKQHRLIISYIEDDVLFNQPNALASLRSVIMSVNPYLVEQHVQIDFENLKQPDQLRRFVHRWGKNARDETSQYSENAEIINLPFMKDPTLIRIQCRQTNPIAAGEAILPRKINWEMPISTYEATFKHLTRQQYLALKGFLPLAYYPVKETDPTFNPNDEQGGRFFGYNSQNYDTTMLAHLMTSIPDPILINAPTLPYDPNVDGYADGKIIYAAHQMRDFNNTLFSEFTGVNDEGKHLSMPDALGSWNDDEKTDGWYIRHNWLQTNRHVDIALLNEKQKRVGLKRLSGVIGRKILESSKLDANSSHIPDIETLADQLAYNVSDVLNTKAEFEQPIYQDAFTLREELLKRFPYLIYAKDPAKQDTDSTACIQEPDHIRTSRLTSDSTSAKFIQNVIAPYGQLEDLPAISYLYPDPKIFAARKKKDPNQPVDGPYDVLENTKEWVEAQDNKYQLNGALIKNFAPIYEFYSEIRGKNVNSTLDATKTYKDQLGNEKLPGPNVDIKALMKRINTNVFYLNNKGERTSSLVTFSIGGIHGAEIKLQKLIDAEKEYDEKTAIETAIKRTYQDDATAANQDNEFTYVDPRQGQSQTFKIKLFLKSGSTKKHADWRVFKQPTIFKKDSQTGINKVRDEYAYVSTGPANHEDFSSYYPVLLVMLAVFRDPKTGVDRYATLYHERLKLKAKLKNFKENTPEYDAIDLAQNLRKLLLNSASGSADAKFYSKIRRNNAIVSMRIIGQLFAWRIGQAEALAGARVPSTNTDGLYTMDIDAETNNRILAETIKPMMIKVDPERLERFVSKDTNNRLEVGLDRKTQKPILLQAKGGTLTSWRGPQPDKSLSHPAIVDNVLARYLAYGDNPADHKIDDAAIWRLLRDEKEKLLDPDPAVRTLAQRMFQWLVVAGTAKKRYPYIKRQVIDQSQVDKLTALAKGGFTSKDEANNWYQQQQASFHDMPWNGTWADGNLKLIAHTNRIYLIRSDNKTQRDILRMATKRTVSAASVASRRRKGEPETNSDPEALAILQEGYGYVPSAVDREEAQIVKISDMPVGQAIMIYNDELVRMSPAMQRKLYDEIDLLGYYKIIASKFYSSWCNLQPSKSKIDNILNDPLAID